MRTRRTRRRPAVITTVLLTAVSTVLLLHSQFPNGRRRAAVVLRQPSRPALNTPSRTPHSSVRVAAGSLRWADFHGIALPVSAHDGPRNTRRGLASGFTDTPAGAVLAAVNIGVRTAAQWGPAIYQPTITRQVTGPGTAALLAAQTAAYRQLRAAAHVPPGQPVSRGYATEAAYRLVSYTPAGATADIVTAGPASGGTTVFAVTRIQVVWRGGDWRVIAPPGGDWANAATTITSLSGYTPFPGEG